MEKVRITKSVKTVLGVFEQTSKAISAVDLVERLHGKMNKTTVYRILERLEEGGLLHYFRGKDGLRWYAMCKKYSNSQHIDSHPHFQCTVCGKTECLHINMSIPKLSNYKINKAELLLIGECRDCLS